MYIQFDTTAVALLCENIGAIVWVSMYISAWASALLVLLVQGNAKASGCETSNKYRLSLKNPNRNATFFGLKT